MSEERIVVYVSEISLAGISGMKGGEEYMASVIHHACVSRRELKGAVQTERVDCEAASRLVEEDSSGSVISVLRLSGCFPSSLSHQAQERRCLADEQSLG